MSKNHEKLYAQSCWRPILCAGFCWLDPEIKQHRVWLTENSYRYGGNGGHSEERAPALEKPQ